MLAIVFYGLSSQINGLNKISVKKLNDKELILHHRNVFTNSNLVALTWFPIRPAHYYEDKDPGAPTLTPPVGSGPYRVIKFDKGYVRYERVKDYWGQNIPLRVGKHNFDFIRYDYYRDQAVALEAFKAGLYDFRFEGSSKDWATGYDFPARNRGDVKAALLKHSRPVGMQAFAFNIRRPQFKTKSVRQALSYAFDFEWSNRQLFYGQYSRTESYFQNSDLAASQLEK